MSETETEAEAPTVVIEPGHTSGSPHDGSQYQDQWPSNPDPSEEAAAQGEINDRILRGEGTVHHPPE